MTASSGIDFQGYLEAVHAAYQHWQNLYTPTDAVGQRRDKQKEPPSLLDFGLMFQPVHSSKAKNTIEREQQRVERLPVLEGLRDFADHVLLIGQPGLGKSTVLVRLLLEEAEKGLRGEQTRVPVLVELRYYKTSVLDLVSNFFKQHGVLLSHTALETLLFEQRLLLLMDGLNELPSEQAHSEVAAFRKANVATPMVFTTRDSGAGGDLGIYRKLEMQPLTEEQMLQFVRAYLPEQGEQMLRQLGNDRLREGEQMLRQLGNDRLRDFGQTPLLLWMLCGLFKTIGTVPQNLGLVFRQFTQSYERHLKEDVLVTEGSRRWWPYLLQNLAFVMMQGEKPIEFRVAIDRHEATAALTEYFQDKVAYPHDLALRCLDDLLSHHLIQPGSGPTIEFRHQALQEYYAAEYLLYWLPHLSNDKVKRDYLNYLKWTEPLVLMLALVNDKKFALRIVKLALEVDLRLGARLAGAAKHEFQEQTVGLIAALDIPKEYLDTGDSSLAIPTSAYGEKIELFAITRSDMVIPHLLLALPDWEA